MEWSHGKGSPTGAVAEEGELGSPCRDGSPTSLFPPSPDSVFSWPNPGEPRRPILQRSVLPGTKQRGKEQIVMVLESQTEHNQYMSTFTSESRTSGRAAATLSSFPCPQGLLEVGQGLCPLPQSPSMPPSHHKQVHHLSRN